MKCIATLILVALVGCGPKPPHHLSDMAPATGVYTLIPECMDGEVVTLRHGAAICINPFPPIDANPYRFTEGEWGEGWPQLYNLGVKGMAYDVNTGRIYERMPSGEYVPWIRREPPMDRFGCL